MLGKRVKRLVPALGTLLILFLVAEVFRRGYLTVSSVTSIRPISKVENTMSQEEHTVPQEENAVPQEENHIPKGSDGNGQNLITIPPPIPVPKDDFGRLDEDMAKRYRQVFSASMADTKYFSIEFGKQKAINPSIIPHPSLENTWIIVAQKQRSATQNSVWFAELVCNAVFKSDVLECIEPPTILPIAATSQDGGKCEGDLAFFSNSVGPHDARVFYGPNAPYTIFGSNSDFTCFGQWMQDFRMLVDWGYEAFPRNFFGKATELQRPAPYAAIEKNWFIFWDSNERMYVHYDIYPKRGFAQLDYRGMITQNLAPYAAPNDERCMTKYMPKLPPELESIHQATNSLSITLCRRGHVSCQPNDFNTFILTIFQHKTFYSFHSLYEPYAMLFKQTSPFEIYGISKKPIWIHGRGKPGQGKKPENLSPEASQSWSQTEMFYITSMNWKAHGQRYHGYIDDVLFIGFGIEDDQTAGIDIVAHDLLLDIGLCSVA
ncbi:hypothetical protein AJ79_08265 [Helicocarpus griseus UAMH5409]|uniref:EH domain-containing protein n=1 Tax=Helicocarpus griseus UAMH5409 TaxID=1447875 RepID=A0A2B7WUR9_9EURO|nr:hypothetical protein AJ79_08265 [Helicocarpus griseus UAMH5409]